MAPVIPLHAIEGGFDFDAMFESLKGHSYQWVVVLAVNGDGEFEWFGNVNSHEANFRLDEAKAELLKGGNP